MSSTNSKFGTYVLPVTGLFALALSCQEADAASKKQPNVIYILTDDQGYGDLACHGNEVIKTPNLDKLHADAVRMTEFHVSPTSAPSRSALFTGRYSNRVGVWHTIGGRSLLWEDETTLSDVLTANGYTCGIFGKWHLGDNYPSRPEDKGFQEVLVHGGGGITQGPDYWMNDYFDDHYRHNGVWEKYEGYCTDVFFGEAIKFIKENKDKPFFCYIPVNAPHAPLNVPEKYYNMYKGNKKINEGQQRFYGMITNIDDNYGILVEELKKLGLEDNTIIMFMTDNGTAHGYKKQGNVEQGHNGGRRGNKNSEYDGGHRVPFFIKYPDGNLKGGYDIDKLTSHIDLLPTMVDLLGLKKGLPEKKLDGKSFMPLLKNKDAKWEDRTIIVDSQRRRNLVKWLKSSVMTQQWRLINGKALYDIQKDPMQTTDIAAEHPEVVKKLRADYDAWWADLKSEGVNERYGYIVAGGPENPVRISAHDMHTESTAAITHVGALSANNPLGIFKIEIAVEGKYKISLCRYPKESGLKFNSVVAGIPKSVEIERNTPEAKQVNFVKADMSIGKYSMSRAVKMDSSSQDYVVEMPDGRFDLDAYFIDENGVKYPPYYVYIEKMN
ncbi:MAG: arylsulfatase [Rikenellaceae bacterium]